MPAAIGARIVSLGSHLLAVVLDVRQSCRILVAAPDAVGRVELQRKAEENRIPLANLLTLLVLVVLAVQRLALEEG